MLDRFREFVDVNALLTQAVSFVPSLFSGIVLFLVFVLLYRLTQVPLRSVLGRAGIHEKLVDLLVGSIYKYTVIIVGLVMALDQLGVNVGAALAGLGVAGIAVGFAAQDSIANLISGFLIFWDKPFVVGDWISAEGRYGRVTNITLRTTRIRTPRNSFVVIPNKTIIDAILENNSKHGELRVDVPVGIAYKEDIAAAREVLLQAVSKLDDVASDPKPDVVVTQLGGSSVDLMLRVWIDEAAHERRVFAAVIEAAKRALDAADIEIPFPHLQLFVEDVRKPVWDSLDNVVGGGRRAS